MVDLNSGSRNKKGLNFELNLIPIFDILSVCICFLLMTVAWIHIGSMNVSQAMGSNVQDHQEKQPAVWAYLNTDGRVVMTLKNTTGLPHKVTDAVVPGGAGGVIEWNGVAQYLASLQKFGPSLRTGLIMPVRTSSYDDIIRLMDQFKKYGIKDIGLYPL
jgi:biopolymer transport protein TolR